MATEVIIEDDRWDAAGLEPLAQRAVGAVFAHLGLDPEAWEVVVLGADDARLAELNGAFRDKPVPTNVLSWPSAERGARTPGSEPEPPSGDPGLGDIALAWETCAREAADQGKPPEQHFLHLIVHGVLHLLGYDHVREGDGDLMESRETAILATLGVPDPYM
jgi:probable rRNA maturation factor